MAEFHGDSDCVLLGWYDGSKLGHLHGRRGWGPVEKEDRFEKIRYYSSENEEVLALRYTLFTVYGFLYISYT